ncbi:MAG: phosphatidic acid phosphatase, partial [Saprospiraceae bacterium]
MKAGFYMSLVILGIFMSACKNKPFDSKVCGHTEYLRDAVRNTTEVIVHDIFSPVVAARIYAYANIAAYEAIRYDHPKKYKSLAGQLNGLTEVPAPPADRHVNFDLAGLDAYLTVSKALIFSESEVEDLRTQIYAKMRADGVPDDVFEASRAYGSVVADHILAWSKKDNYAQTRSFPKYTVTNEKGRWQPTPPAYIEGVEPNWSQIRPMTLDSARQFPPLPPYPFSTDKNSKFFQEAMEVYKLDDTDKENKVAIANFWDCNPYVMHQQGHLMFATKKMTPGGHWMGIVGLATRKAGLDMAGTAEAYTLTSIGLFDSFISC